MDAGRCSSPTTLLITITGTPHRAWGYPGAVSWGRGFDLIRSPTESTESHMRSEPHMFAHLVRAPLSTHSDTDKYPYGCTPHCGSEDTPWAPLPCQKPGEVGRKV